MKDHQLVTNTPNFGQKGGSLGCCYSLLPPSLLRYGTALDISTRSGRKSLDLTELDRLYLIGAVLSSIPLTR